MLLRQKTWLGQTGNGGLVPSTSVIGINLWSFVVIDKQWWRSRQFYSLGYSLFAWAEICVLLWTKQRSVSYRASGWCCGKDTVQQRPLSHNQGCQKPGLGWCQETAGFTVKDCYDTIRTDSSKKSLSTELSGAVGATHGQVRLDILLESRHICNHH